MSMLRAARGAHVGLVLLLAAPAAAFADGPPAPAFVTLDRADASTRFGIEGSVLLFNNNHTEPPGEKLTGGTLELHGQYVNSWLGLGGYVTMPFSFISGSYETATESSSDHYAGVGDLEAGVIYAPPIPLAGFGLPIHVGITVPSGSTSQSGFYTNRDDVYPRFTDFALNYPRGTTLRAAFAPTFDSRYVFARIDVGFDANFASENNRGGGLMNVVTENLIRLNAAVGVKLGALGISLESTNVYFIPNRGDNNGGGFGSSWNNTGALGFRVRTDYLEPYAAIVFPIDYTTRFTFDAAFTFGIDLVLPPPRPPPPIDPTDGEVVPDPT